MRIIHGRLEKYLRGSVFRLKPFPVPFCYSRRLYPAKYSRPPLWIPAITTGCLFFVRQTVRRDEVASTTFRRQWGTLSAESTLVEREKYLLRGLAVASLSPPASAAEKTRLDTLRRTFIPRRKSRPRESLFREQFRVVDARKRHFRLERGSN